MVIAKDIEMAIALGAAAGWAGVRLVRERPTIAVVEKAHDRSNRCVITDCPAD
jgi:hypothetical protein